MKEEIKTVDDLLNIVTRKIKGSIHHYTSYESLVSILKHKTFRLTRLDLLNDKAEERLANCHDNELRYNLSFSNTYNESVAMWAIYGGRSSMKLRLSLSRKKLIESFNNNFYFDHEKLNIIPYGSFDMSKNAGQFVKKQFSLYDVVYLNKKNNQLRYSSKTLKGIVVDERVIERFKGFIKYSAWEFESEARISVLINRNMNFVQKINEPQYIYGGISDDLLKSFKITFNPWIAKEMKDEIKDSLNRLADCDLKYEDSSLEGQVDLM